MAFKHISVSELQDKIGTLGDKVSILDIRDPNSYEAGHIPGAIRVDNDNVAQVAESLDKANPLIVCCYHGNSSQSAADYFNQMGFDDSYSLDGGYAAWPKS